MERMFRVLVASGSFGKADPEPVRMLEKAGCELVPNELGRPLKDREMAAIVAEKGIHGIIAGLDEVGPLTLGASDTLKAVSRHGTGVDNIDFDAARRHGVVVTNTPSTNASGVADLVLGLILALFRRLIEVHRHVQEGRWERPTGLELGGKVLGIVGYGRVGRLVAKRALAFDARVLAYDPYVRETDDERITLCRSLDELLAQSDVVTLHLPNTPETVGLIDAAAIARMKPGGFLINTARGELVDERALAEAVRSGRLGGAGVDVYRQEPPADSPLIGVPGIITTSHIGALTDRSLKETSLICAQNLLAVLNGEPCSYIVNK